MNAVQLALFIKSITPELMRLGKFLFQRFKGDAQKAKRELVHMQDYWASYDADNARIDAELEELKEQGK